MSRRLPTIIVLLSLAGSLACLGGSAALPPCDPRSSDDSICGLTNPEDLGFLPDRSWIIVSEMAPAVEDPDEEDQGQTRGRLTAIRLADFERRALTPLASDLDSTGMAARAPSMDWGDAGCPGAPDLTVFAPHGIDVGKSQDGRPVLAVVNHGGREAVEFFEIRSGRAPSLVWRGCVVMPDGISINDVALLPSGGFVVTNFMPAFDGVGPKAIWTLVKIRFGGRTGSVLKWEPGNAIKEIENSQGSAPNGVVVSPDGSEVFVAEWGRGAVYRLRLDEDGSPRRDEVRVDHSPDNLTWTRDGRLLVAGQYGGIWAALGCASIRDAGCDIGYSVYLIEPVALEAEKLVEGRGAASVALEVGDEIFVGAFIGDQIERVRWPD